MAIFLTVVHLYQSNHTHLFVSQLSYYGKSIMLTCSKCQQPHGGGFVLGTSPYSANSTAQRLPAQGSGFTPDTSTYSAGPGIAQGSPANSGNFNPNLNSPFATTPAFTQPQPFPESAPIYRLQPFTSVQVSSILLISWLLLTRMNRRQLPYPPSRFNTYQDQIH